MRCNIWWERAMVKTGVGATWGRSESNWRLELSRPRTFGGRRSELTVRSHVPAIPGGSSFTPRHCHQPDLSGSRVKGFLLAQGKGGLNMTNRQETGHLQEHGACREKPKNNPQSAVASRFVARNSRLANSSNTTGLLRTSTFLRSRRGLRWVRDSLPGNGLVSHQHPQKWKAFRALWQLSYQAS